MQPSVLPVFTQPSGNNHRYQMIQRLGGGAMGSVFLAQDEQQRRVAIKLPATSGRWRAEYERRVIKEIGILSKLQHPNIIEVFDWGREPEPVGPYLVMEYLEGGSVLQLMMSSPGQKLNPLEALRITAAVADALAYAHALQPPIIHRDIKPDNILVRRADGQVKVSDFGLAAVMERGRAMTQWGTPDYIAPEQALGKGADGRSDLYALAATLYHMVTGMRPPSLGMPLPARPSANILPGLLHSDQARRLDYLIITLLAYDPNNRRPAPGRKSWHAVDVAEELRAIAERRPARLYPGPEDSAIFPNLLTGMIPPAGAPQPRPAQAPRPQPMPQGVPPPPPPPLQAQPLPPHAIAPQPWPGPPPPAPQAEQVVLFHPPSPTPMQQVPAPPPVPMPQQVRPSGGIPVPIPPTPQPQQARPSGVIPVPGQQPPPLPAAAFQAPPPPLPPPASQIRPAPLAIPVQPTPLPPRSDHASPTPPAASTRKAGLLPAEKEAIAGALIGLVGVIALSVVFLSLPQFIDNFLFDALVFVIILWVVGLVVGVASPRGRRGRFPFLALVITVLVVVIGFPLVQVVRVRDLNALLDFVALLAGWPIIIVGAFFTWLAVKALGKDES